MKICLICNIQKTSNFHKRQMPEQSKLIPLKINIPAFRLKDTNSNFFYSFEDLRGTKGTLVVFISNQCTDVQHALPEILMIAADYNVQGLGIIAISSNDASKSPQDGPEMMAEFAFKHSFDFPYLYDESQDVARAFGVLFAPDYFLFDNQDQLLYRGQLDDSRPANGIPLSGSDLRNAIDGLIYNRLISQNQKPSSGCATIWRNY